MVGGGGGDPDDVTVVEDRPIMSVKYCLSISAKTNAPCSAVSLR